jgi:hypothetical protein
MDAQLIEAKAVSQRSEREYTTLRDSIKQLTDQWQKEITSLREEFKAREDEWHLQIEDSGSKYRSLLKLVQATQ